MNDMDVIQKLASWLDRRRDSIWTHNLERDWRKWSWDERIVASLLAISIALMPIALFRL